jgi:hypothetical protein
MPEYKGLHLYEWMKRIKGDIVPPFCVELFLINNHSYFINGVTYWEDDDPIAVVRIWDLRIMTDDDIVKLKEAMNNARDRREYEKPDNIHKKLDWANLRVSKDYIAYVIEWHDRLWPGSKIGFKAEMKNK